MSDALMALFAIVLTLVFVVFILVMGMALQLNEDKTAIVKQFCQPKCAQGEVASVDKKDNQFVCSCTYTKEVK